MFLEEGLIVMMMNRMKNNKPVSRPAQLPFVEIKKDKKEFEVLEELKNLKADMDELK